MASDKDLVELTGLELPPTSATLRDHVLAPERRTKVYDEKYDRHTLFYDCVRLDKKSRLLVTAPPFLNLWPEFRQGLQQGGHVARIRRHRRFELSEQLEIADDGAPLTFQGFSLSENIRVRPSRSDAFEGLNCLVTVSKNEPLEWITDWIGYHVKQHRANAVVIVDNGSTDYSPETLIEHLRMQPGIQRALVYSAKFPYGAPVGAGKGERIPMFFQSAMLDIVRRDALARARAVLSIDVDELVVRKGETGVFDAAVRKRNTMIKIHGEWVFPSGVAKLPAPHKEHVFRTTPRGKCKQKWCAVPSGVLSTFGWRPHHVGGEFVRFVPKSSEFHLLHCRGTSRAWKADRFAMPELTEPDPDLVSLMDTVFQKPAET